MSLIQDQIYQESIHESAYENREHYSQLELASDADWYSIHKNHQGEFLDRSITVEQANKQAYMDEIDKLLGLVRI
jgi:hypothetical protein